MNRIAQDAGVSIKTLYRHFESKDELFGAVIASLWNGSRLNLSGLLVQALEMGS